MTPAEDLERALRHYRPHQLEAEIPAEMRGWLLEIDWDLARLWDIQRSSRLLPTDEMHWHFDLPWWQNDQGEHFKVTPHDVMSDVDAFPEHYARILRADLGCPVHVIRRRSRWLILDGVHRAAKAKHLGVPDIEVIVITPSDLPVFAVS